MIYFTVIFTSKHQPQILSEPNFHQGPLEIGTFFFKSVDKSLRNGAAFQRQQKEKPAPVHYVVVCSFPIRCWLRAALPFEEEEERALWQSPFPKTPSRPSLIPLISPEQFDRRVQRKHFSTRDGLPLMLGERALSAVAFETLSDMFPHYFSSAKRSQDWEEKIKSPLRFHRRWKCKKNQIKDAMQFP